MFLNGNLLPIGDGDGASYFEQRTQQNQKRLKKKNAKLIAPIL
jgi:hypothetical protein